jgi:ABC-type lipoprotein export system ATPase subunit
MIRFEAVTKTVASGAEQLTILDRVDLFVPAGQFVAVTGGSGSGKSTLLSLVAGSTRRRRERCISRSSASAECAKTRSPTSAAPWSASSSRRST